MGTRRARSFMAPCDHHGFLSLFVTCGEMILCCRLRMADRSAAQGSLEERSPDRGAGPQRMADNPHHGPWRRRLRHGRDHGLVRGAWHRRCLWICAEPPSERDDRENARDIAAAHVWCRARHQGAIGICGIAPAPHGPASAVWWSRPHGCKGLRGRNARDVVTNISSKEMGARELCEQLSCARGDMENRIKDQQLWLFCEPHVGSHHAGQPAADGRLGLCRRPRRHCAPDRSEGHRLCPLARRHHPLPAAQACRQSGRRRCAGSASVWRRPLPCRTSSPAPSPTCVPRPRCHQAHSLPHPLVTG